MLIGGIVHFVGLAARGMDITRPDDDGMVIAPIMLYGLRMTYLIGARRATCWRGRP